MPSRSRRLKKTACSKSQSYGPNHLGNFYYRTGSGLKAEKEFLLVLNDDQFQSKWENSYARTGLARLYYDRKDFRKAAEEADSGYNLAMSVRSKWDVVQVLDIAQRSYKAIEDFHSAYDIFQLLTLYQDSINSGVKDGEIMQLLLKHMK